MRGEEKRERERRGKETNSVNQSKGYEKKKVDDRETERKSAQGDKVKARRQCERKRDVGISENASCATDYTPSWQCLIAVIMCALSSLFTRTLFAQHLKSALKYT